LHDSELFDSRRQCPVQMEIPRIMSPDAKCLHFYSNAHACLTAHLPGRPGNESCGLTWHAQRHHFIPGIRRLLLCEARFLVIYCRPIVELLDIEGANWQIRSQIEQTDKHHDFVGGRRSCMGRKRKSSNCAVLIRLAKCPSSCPPHSLRIMRWRLSSHYFSSSHTVLWLGEPKVYRRDPSPP
jgi:hypothetical protein